MKKKIKKIFENTVWWSGVVMVGLILGASLQFVRAWTEPTVAPPGGNVGAPINTSIIPQKKEGLLSAFGLMTSWFYKVPQLGEANTTNSVLTLKDPTTGETAWAAGGGGGCYVDYSLGTGLAVGTSCGAVGGFTIKRSVGQWGSCYNSGAGAFRPPGGGCSGWMGGIDQGEAYVCCM